MSANADGFAKAVCLSVVVATVVAAIEQRWMIWASTNVCVLV